MARRSLTRSNTSSLWVGGNAFLRYTAGQRQIRPHATDYAPIHIRAPIEGVRYDGVE